jgi:hypothetical protein
VLLANDFRARWQATLDHALTLLTHIIDSFTRFVLERFTYDITGHWSLVNLTR